MQKDGVKILIFYMRDLQLQHYPDHVRKLGAMLASTKEATLRIQCNNS